MANEVECLSTVVGRCFSPGKSSSARSKNKKMNMLPIPPAHVLLIIYQSSIL